MNTTDRVKWFLGGCFVGLIGLGMLSDGNNWGLAAFIIGFGCILQAFEKSKPKYDYKGSTTIHHLKKRK